MSNLWKTVQCVLVLIIVGGSFWLIIPSLVQSGDLVAQIIGVIYTLIMMTWTISAIKELRD